MQEAPEQVEVWVVVRLDHYLREAVNDDLENMITLREALPTRAEAHSEAARLNALREEGDDGVQYFAAPTRYFPHGRNVEVGY